MLLLVCGQYKLVLHFWLGPSGSWSLSLLLLRQLWISVPYQHQNASVRGKEFKEFFEMHCILTVNAQGLRHAWWDGPGISAQFLSWHTDGTQHLSTASARYAVIYVTINAEYNCMLSILVFHIKCSLFFSEALWSLRLAACSLGILWSLWFNWRQILTSLDTWHWPVACSRVPLWIFCAVLAFNSLWLQLPRRECQQWASYLELWQTCARRGSSSSMLSKCSHSGSEVWQEFSPVWLQKERTPISQKQVTFGNRC